MQVTRRYYQLNIPISRNYMVNMPAVRQNIAQSKTQIYFNLEVKPIFFTLQPKLWQFNYCINLKAYVYQ